MSATPLAGIKVLEFSHRVMGPTTGLVFAELGAGVIKVEPAPKGRQYPLVPSSRNRISGSLRRAGARDAGGIAAALRAFDGPHGRRRAGDLRRAQPERVFRAADTERKADGCSCSGLARRVSAARCSGAGNWWRRHRPGRRARRRRSSAPRRRAATSRRIGRV